MLQLQLLKGISTKDVFQGIFLSFHSRTFSKHPQKIHDVTLFVSIKILNSNSVTLGKFPVISENSQETFFLESAYVEVGDYGLCTGL